MTVSDPVTDVRRCRVKHSHRIAGILPFMVAFSGLLLFMTSAGAAETGSIVGQLADERGRVTYIGNAVVFLCDAISGLPILTTTKKPFDPDSPDSLAEGMTNLWHAVTTDRSVFEFKEVPVGRYGLVAQSWSGTNGLPDFQAKPSTVVVLHGVSEGVEVKANEVTTVYPRKLGDGILKIVNDPEEPHAFLLISRNPRLGDGVLGPAAWGKEFLSGLIGVTQMERPYVTLVGLPDGKTIHVGLFNYDNNPGVGGDSYTVGQDQSVRLKIYATWSNGKYEPPERLAKLTDYLDENSLSASSLIGLEGGDSKNREALWELIHSDTERRIRVDGVGEFRLIDILAAAQYKSLRRFHRARAK